VRVLIFDQEYLGLNLALRAQAWEHDVRIWHPRLHDGSPCPVGDGVLYKVDDWKPHVDWADLILNTGNAHYRNDFAPLFDKGYPVFGTNEVSAQLELDRYAGQLAFEKAGIPTLQYEVCANVDQAIKYVKTQKDGCAIKPWGGSGDKALSLVGKSAEDCEYVLQRWKAEKRIKGKLLCQARVDGIEMAAGGWFGPGGWAEPINETWEHKKHLAGDLGCNTGEQGSVLRYTKRSKLFEKVVRPLTEILHQMKFVGNCDVNCMIDGAGRPWPLEFTMRFGWPAINIMLALHEGDPIEWMLDLLHGKDTLRVSRDIAMGVVMSHGRYPFTPNPWSHDVGWPIQGITPRNWTRICPQHMRKNGEQWETAGEYVCVVTGVGPSVRAAGRAAYHVVCQLSWPHNYGYRIDIGRRMAECLPKLQSMGYAGGVEYGS
jgi:phosphoribosylamine---glycine ligase